MTTLTWDNVPPTRPALTDVGNLAVENDPLFPPPTDPSLAATGKFPTANMFNQAAAQAVALARLTPALIVQVLYDAFNVPYVLNAITPGGWLDNFDPFSNGGAPFTVLENAPGDVEVHWPAGSLPSNGEFLTWAIGGVYAATATFVSFTLLPHGFNAFTLNHSNAGVRVPFAFIGY